MPLLLIISIFAQLSKLLSLYACMSAEITYLNVYCFWFDYMSLSVRWSIDLTKPMFSAWRHYGLLLPESTTCHRSLFAVGGCHSSLQQWTGYRELNKSYRVCSIWWDNGCWSWNGATLDVSFYICLRNFVGFFRKTNLFSPDFWSLILWKKINNYIKNAWMSS